MMEWLVHIRITLPPDMDPSVVADLYRREGERVKELTKDGYCQRLWRVTGETANWGVWTADNATDLHAALESLPLWRYFRDNISVIPLALNVNDPARGEQQGLAYIPDPVLGAGYR